ncbi:hypothetical protein [Methanobrevibacter thaueri]|jgi:anaerobic ribonucleoside-triphosphate reductase|nr:hypothetical protein [Methanobrevibacter thaueri]
MKIELDQDSSDDEEIIKKIHDSNKEIQEFIKILKVGEIINEQQRDYDR